MSLPTCWHSNEMIAGNRSRRQTSLSQPHQRLTQHQLQASQLEDAAADLGKDVGVAVALQAFLLLAQALLGKEDGGADCLKFKGLT